MACHRAAPPVHATSGGARGRGGHASAHRAARRAAPAPHLRPRTEPPAPTARACLLAGLLVAVTSVPARRDRPPPEPPPPHPPWPRNRGAAHPSPPPFWPRTLPSLPTRCAKQMGNGHTRTPQAAPHHPSPPPSGQQPGVGGGGAPDRSHTRRRQMGGGWGGLAVTTGPPPHGPLGAARAGGRRGAERRGGGRSHQKRVLSRTTCGTAVTQKAGSVTNPAGPGRGERWAARRGLECPTVGWVSANRAPMGALRGPPPGPSPKQRGKDDRARTASWAGGLLRPLLN